MVQDTAALKALELKTTSLKADLEKCKGSLSSMVPKADFVAAEKAAKAAEGAVSSAQSKLTQLEKELAAAKVEGSQLAKKAAAAANDLSKAQKETSVCEREVSQLKASYKMADNDALNLRTRLEEAEKALIALSSRHSSEWLPHWLEESVGKWTQEGWTMAQQGVSSAVTTWNTQIWPWTLSTASTMQTEGSKLFTQGLELLKERGIEAPAGVKNAGEKFKKAFEIAVASDIVLKSKSNIQSAYNTAIAQACVVVSELESILVDALKQYPTFAPLTQKPLSTLCVYFLLFAPVVAIGMPLLASSKPSAKETSQKKKKGAKSGATSASSQQQQQTSQGASVGSRKTPAGSKKQTR